MFMFSIFMAKRFAGMLRCRWEKGPEICLTPKKAVVIGRNKTFAIRDTKCSRKQVTVSLENNRKRARIVCHGTHSSYVNNKVIPSDGLLLNHGDKISLLNNEGYVMQYECHSDTQNDDSAAKLNGDKVETKETGVKSLEPSVQTVHQGWSKVSNELVVYTPKEPVNRSKIACFDLDGTLICTQSGNVFAKHDGDWRLLYPEIPKKLRQMHEDGYKIVIISNQMGVANGKVKLDGWQRKCQAILTKFSVPILVLASIGGSLSRYRKPLPGMWNALINHHNAGIPVDIKQSIYVGDAAGRPATKTRKKDHSSGDRFFAENIGIPFATPEQFLLGHKEDPAVNLSFCPKTFVTTKLPLFVTRENESLDSLITSSEPEIVVLVGYPGSGKSTFVQKYLLPQGYAVANRDTLKSWNQCVAACEKSLKSKKSIVVDNTNPDKLSRLRYVQVAKELQCKIRCLLMNCDYAHAKHNVKYRALMGTDKEHKDVNEMVLNTYRAKFEQPDLEEGFYEILGVNMQPTFEDDKARELYSMYLCDK